MSNYPCYVFDLGWQIKYYEEEFKKEGYSWKKGKGLSRVDYLERIQNAWMSYSKVKQKDRLIEELKGLGIDIKELGLFFITYDQMLKLKDNIYQRLSLDKEYNQLLWEAINGSCEELNK